jgi:hypothetical protein
MEVPLPSPSEKLWLACSAGSLAMVAAVARDPASLQIPPSEMKLLEATETRDDGGVVDYSYVHKTEVMPEEMTCLMISVYLGHTDIVDFLLKVVAGNSYCSM